MDPNATLAEIRDIVATSIQSGNSEWASARLVELVDALDSWLSRGGFAPECWTRTETRKVVRRA